MIDQVIIDKLKHSNYEDSKNILTFLIDDLEIDLYDEITKEWKYDEIYFCDNIKVYDKRFITLMTKEDEYIATLDTYELRIISNNKIVRLVGNRTLINLDNLVLYYNGFYKHVCIIDSQCCNIFS